MARPRPTVSSHESRGHGGARGEARHRPVAAHTTLTWAAAGGFDFVGRSGLLFRLLVDYSFIRNYLPEDM
jgi:hypothetical protein